MCPKCGKPLTIGVLHRVAELSDRPEGHRPTGAAASANLVSLPEIIGEIRSTGRQSKRVTMEVDRLVAALGPELHILCDADIAEIRRAAGGLVAEAIARLRNGDVIKAAGYDGEYGVIRLFRPEELAGTEALFDVPVAGSAPESPDIPAPALSGQEPFEVLVPAVSEGPVDAQASPTSGEPFDVTALAASGEEFLDVQASAAWREDGRPGRLLAGLDPGQREAALATGPLMILAGPGTGKTRTLTRRIAIQVVEHGVAPEACLALTFTRRAAAEMRERLAALLPGEARRLMITTFHGLGLAILREHGERAGLEPGFTVADDRTRLAVAVAEAGSEAAGRRLLAKASRDPAVAGEFAGLLASRGMVDFDGLISLTLALLQEAPDLVAALRARWRSISVDEYQDTDAGQYALLRLLAGDGSGLAVIGDPDQAIYGFRGADVGFFLSFTQDYAGGQDRRADP
jgi:hypothetical protein